MKRIIYLFATIIASFAAASCDPDTIDVIDNGYSVTVTAQPHANVETPVTLKLIKGDLSQSYQLAYKIDSRDDLYFVQDGNVKKSPLTISFGLDSTMTLVMPSLPAGEHSILMQFTSKKGYTYDYTYHFEIESSPVPVTAISVPSQVTLTAGDSKSVNVEVSPSDADDRMLKVTTSNPLVADVQLNSLTLGQATQQLDISAKMVGTATVTVSDRSGQCKSSFTITVNGIQATDIKLSASSLNIKVGQQQSVTYSLVPDNVTDRHLTATVADTRIATATVSDDSIVVVGVSAGSTQLSVECAGYMRTIGVTVYDGTITVSPASVNSLAWGAQATFSVTATGQYTVNYDKSALELVTSNSTSFILKNISPEYVKKDVSFTVTSNDDTSVKATVAMYAEPKPETITVSNVSSGEGVATYNVAGDNLGWKIISIPSGLTSSVSGQTITLQNDSFETLSGTMKVRTDKQGIVASVGVSVPGKSISVTSVTISPDSFSMKEGSEQTFALKVTYSNGKSEDITSSADWSQSSNLSPVTGKPGTFKGTASGGAWVSGTYGGKIAKASGNVSAATISSLTMTPANDQSLKIGESFSVSLVASYDNGTKKYDILDKASWSYDNGIITMSPAGTFKAVKTGSTTVKATYEGKTAQVKVSVTRTLKGLSAATASYSLTAGNTATVKITATYDDGTAEDVTSRCSFTSGNQSVASVSGSTLSAKSAGSTTIKASYNGFSTQFTVNVTAATIPVASISLSRTSLSLKEGDTANLTWTISPSDATDRSIVWESSNKSVATIDGNGKVTACSAGTATITARCGGKSATCTVTVTKAPVIITLNATSLELEAGDTYSLSASTKPYSNVTWESSDITVATVVSGVVIAKNAGNTVITAKAEDGSQATCNVTVKAKAAQSVSLDKSAITMTVGGTETLIATTNPNGLSLSWASANAGIASVDNTGKVTAKAAGTTTVFACTPDGATAECTVTVSNQGKVWIECLSDLNNIHCGDTVVFKAWYEHPAGGKIDITSEITLDIAPYNWARKLSAGKWIVDDSQPRTYTVTSIYGYRGKYDNDAVLVFPEREFTFSTTARPHGKDYVTVSVEFTPLNGGSVIYNYSPMKFYDGDSKSIAKLLGNQFSGYDYSWKITINGETYNGTYNLNVMKGDPQDVLYHIDTDKVKANVLLDYQ